MGIIFFFFYFGNLANRIVSTFAMKKSPLACHGRPRPLNGGYGKIMAVMMSRFCYQKLRASCLALLQAATIGGHALRGTFLKTHLKNRSENSFQNLKTKSKKEGIKPSSSLYVSLNQLHSSRHLRRTQLLSLYSLQLHYRSYLPIAHGSYL